MAYDKHKILIDLEEYNVLKDAKDSIFFADLYKKCICALINTKGDVEAANIMIIGTQYEIKVGSKRIHINPSHPPHIPGEIIPMEAITITPITK